MTRKEFRMALAEVNISQAKLAGYLGTTPHRISRAVQREKFPVEVRLFLRTAINHGLDHAKELAR